MPPCPKTFALFWPLVLSCTLLTSSVHGQIDPKVTASNKGNSIEIKIGSEPFTNYDFSSYKKPVFFPLFGPSQISMTRQFPMVKGVPGESDDHPHHKSMWLGHEINGVDFWSERNGTVKLRSRKIDRSGFEAQHDWINDDDNSVVTTDTVHVQFGANATTRWIDYKITFHAASDPVVFADTKEGTFAIRVHPQLRAAADKVHGVGMARGKMQNANGTTGKNIWGQKAKWVRYSGAIDGQACGIAIFDHPSNLRHPTTWHARDYGLFAANPFGLHYFAQQKKGTGEFILEPGKSLSLRYRVNLHLGARSSEQLASEFQNFAKSK